MVGEQFKVGRADVQKLIQDVLVDTIPAFDFVESRRFLHQQSFLFFRVCWHDNIGKELGFPLLDLSVYFGVGLDGEFDGEIPSLGVGLPLVNGVEKSQIFAILLPLQIFKQKLYSETVFFAERRVPFGSDRYFQKLAHQFGNVCFAFLLDL